MSITYFTSDPHIGHKLVAGLRGFIDPEDHDNILAENWDRLVKPDDVVWVCGDISAGDAAQRKALAWLCRRPGRKHLILGNHDGPHPNNRDAHKWFSLYMGAFESVASGARRRVLGRNVLLSHFPYTGDHREKDRYDQWRLRDKGEILIHGHLHDPDRRRVGNQIHVGLDAWDLTPVPLMKVEELVQEIE
jgi:calcineurin-like phosphoesterase family protein